MKSRPRTLARWRAWALVAVAALNVPALMASAVLVMSFVWAWTLGAVSTVEVSLRNASGERLRVTPVALIEGRDSFRLLPVFGPGFPVEQRPSFLDEDLAPGDGLTLRYVTDDILLAGVVVRRASGELRYVLVDPRQPGSLGGISGPGFDELPIGPVDALPEAPHDVLTVLGEDPAVGPPPAWRRLLWLGPAVNLLSLVAAAIAVWMWRRRVTRGPGSPRTPPPRAAPA